MDGIPISGGCTIHLVLRPPGIRPIAVGYSTRCVSNIANIVLYCIALYYIIHRAPLFPLFHLFPIILYYRILYYYYSALYYITQTLFD